MGRPSKKTPSALGVRLKHARQKRGLRQEELAEKAGVGQSDVSKLERGDSQKTTFVLAYARALRVPPEWLEFGEGDEPKWATTGPNAPPAPDPQFKDRRLVSPTDWGLLQDVKLVLPELELERIRSEADRVRRIANEQLDGKGKT